MFIFEGKKFLWINPVKLGTGIVDGTLECGSTYFTVFPISSKKYREVNPTKAKILINEETGTIEILDDCVRPHHILLDGVPDQWVKLVRDVGRENYLCK